MSEIIIFQPKIEVHHNNYINLTNSNSYDMSRIFCNDYNIGTEARYELPISNYNE